jgi:hypothetical protein
MKPALLTILSFLTALACEPADEQNLSKAAYIELSAEDAVFSEEGGELIASLPSEALETVTWEQINVDDVDNDVNVVGDFASAPPEFVAFCYMLYDCVNNGNGTMTCKIRMVSPGACAAH